MKLGGSSGGSGRKFDPAHYIYDDDDAGEESSPPIILLDVNNEEGGAKKRKKRSVLLDHAPKEGGAKKRKKKRSVREDYDYEDLLVYREDPSEPEPVLSSFEHREIGWMCGEPMPDYAHVVFQSAR